MDVVDGIHVRHGYVREILVKKTFLCKGWFDGLMVWGGFLRLDGGTARLGDSVERDILYFTVFYCILLYFTLIGGSGSNRQ